ncbi:MAG: hypothetical protein Q7J82_03555 [Coriobacteriia bacterium]|nr:hypothetical protein [Coriobacteriia bacterium]
MKKTLLIGIVAAALVMGMVAYATAATTTATVSATVNPKLEITTNATSITFDAVDPGATNTKSTTFTVKSNNRFTVARSEVVGDYLHPVVANDSYNYSDFSTDMHVSYADLDQGTGAYAKGGAVEVKDTLTIAPTWDVASGAYSGAYLYTVTQI